MADVFRRPVEVDILVRGWDNLDLTWQCLESIQRNTPRPDYRITYVDNGSEDVQGLAGLLSDFPDVQIVRLPFNHGSVRAINHGLACALLSPSRFVLLMDNDTTVPAGDTTWLERFVGCFDNEQVGAAGAVSGYVSGYQQAEAVLDLFQKAWQVDGEAGLKEPPSMPVLVSFAMMIRKEAFLQVGFFDERYEPGNSEDFDYVIQLREAGWKAVVANSVWINHKGSQTFRKFDFPALLETNSQKLVEKWGAAKLAAMGLRVTNGQKA